jgi:hypothetical protein
MIPVVPAAAAQAAAVFHMEKRKRKNCPRLCYFYYSLSIPFSAIYSFRLPPASNGRHFPSAPEAENRSFLPAQSMINLVKTVICAGEVK